MESQFLSQLDLGRIEFNLGLVSDSLEETIEWVEKSRDHRGAALHQDPHHGLARRDFIISSDALARNYLQVPEKLPRAQEVISEGVREARNALAAAPDNLEFRSQLTACLQTAGIVEHELGRHESAEDFFHDADSHIQTLLEKDRVRFRGAVSTWLAERSEFRVLRNQSADAEKDRQLSLQLIDELLPTLLEGDPVREIALATRQKLLAK
ncbi:MAG: hypothetical protein JSS02_16560, partial [Planctomycetes bacterium]|nr:hypothetical protein [Planctomycetota bacterium]